MENIYEQNFDVKKISAENKKKYMKHSLTTFPPAASIILHIITMGIFTMIYYGLKHGQLPKIKDDDFGAGKAIGFLFIPFFNFYWIFRFWIGLIDRVNLQLKLRNMEVVPRGLAITIPILVVTSIIPFIGYLTTIANYFIVTPITLALLQSSINKLAGGK
ncbi:hypothetical protein KY343_00070 [Candidatus Woesearchaeota archaeon]|nr:hypothetical protein [Candidatus Woesearchaeota archaeon]